jgi:hypothetical protein
VHDTAPAASSSTSAPHDTNAGTDTVALVIDKDQHRPLAEYCRIMLRRLQGQ